MRRRDLLAGSGAWWLVLALLMPVQAGAAGPRAPAPPTRRPEPEPESEPETDADEDDDEEDEDEDAEPIVPGLRNPGTRL